MCAARIEILASNAVVKHLDQTIGQGPGVYKLRNYDRKLDVFHKLDIEKEGTSGLKIEFGEGVGRAQVITDEHDTIISVEVYSASMGVGSAGRGGAPVASTGGIILDETYGHGRPEPAPIVDANGEVLAIVTHQKTRKGRKTRI